MLLRNVVPESADSPLIVTIEPRLYPNVHVDSATSLARDVPWLCTSQLLDASNASSACARDQPYLLATTVVGFCL